MPQEPRTACAIASDQGIEDRSTSRLSGASLRRPAKPERLTSAKVRLIPWNTGSRALPQLAEPRARPAPRESLALRGEAQGQRRPDVGDDLAGAAEAAVPNEHCRLGSQTFLLVGESIEESADVGGVLGPLGIVP